MDLDHRPGSDKLFPVAIAVSGGVYPLQKIVAEIAKCDVVCANCHRERTYRRREG
jgi:hypothetical protein